MHSATKYLYLTPDGTDYKEVYSPDNPPPIHPGLTNYNKNNGTIETRLSTITTNLGNVTEKVNTTLTNAVEDLDERVTANANVIATNSAAINAIKKYYRHSINCYQDSPITSDLSLNFAFTLSVITSSSAVINTSNKLIQLLKNISSVSGYIDTVQDAINNLNIYPIFGYYKGTKGALGIAMSDEIIVIPNHSGGYTYSAAVAYIVESGTSDPTSFYTKSIALTDDCSVRDTVKEI